MKAVDMNNKMKFPKENEIWWAREHAFGDYENMKKQRPVFVLGRKKEKFEVLKITSNTEDKWFYINLDSTITKQTVISTVQINEHFYLDESDFIDFSRNATKREIQKISEWKQICFNNITLFLLSKYELQHADRQLKKHAVDIEEMDPREKVREYIADVFANGQHNNKRINLEIWKHFTKTSAKEEMTKWELWLKYESIRDYVHGAQKETLAAVHALGDDKNSLNWGSMRDIISQSMRDTMTHEEERLISKNSKFIREMLKENFFFWNKENFNILGYEQFFYNELKSEEKKIRTKIGKFLNTSLPDVLTTIIIQLNLEDYSGGILTDDFTEEELETQYFCILKAYFEVMKLKKEQKTEDWMKQNGSKHFETMNRIEHEGENLPNSQKEKINFLKKTLIFGWERITNKYIKDFIKGKIWKKQN